MSDAPQQSSNKTLWIVLGTIGGIIVACGGCSIAAIVGVYMAGTEASRTFDKVGSTIESHPSPKPETFRPNDQ